MLRASLARFQSTVWSDLLERTATIFRSTDCGRDALYPMDALNFIAMRVADFTLFVGGECQRSDEYLVAVRKASGLTGIVATETADLERSNGSFWDPQALSELEPFPSLRAVLWAGADDVEPRETLLLAFVVSEFSASVFESLQRLFQDVENRVRSQLDERIALRIYAVHNDHLIGLALPELYGRDAHLLWNNGLVYSQSCIELMFDMSASSADCAGAIHSLAERLVSLSNHD